jgi:hypothetical protein
VLEGVRPDQGVPSVLRVPGQDEASVTDQAPVGVVGILCPLYARIEGRGVDPAGDSDGDAYVDGRVERETIGVQASVVGVGGSLVFGFASGN